MGISIIYLIILEPHGYRIIICSLYRN